MGRINESTAIPQFLDAPGYQKPIREAQADYLLRVKADQGSPSTDLQHGFAHAEQTRFANMPPSHDRFVNKDHGGWKRVNVGS